MKKLRLENLDLVSFAFSRHKFSSLNSIFSVFSPETAQLEEWRKLFVSVKGRIALVAMDEAHCIFEWLIGGASAASEATLSSCPLRFAVYVGGFSTCNQSLRRYCSRVVVMAGGRLRGRRFDSPIATFFFTPFLSFFFCLTFPPLFFLHARSAISMLKHFSSSCNEVVSCGTVSCIFRGTDFRRAFSEVGGPRYGSSHIYKWYTLS